MTKLTKIVLTGAAGRLGSFLRAPLGLLADQLLSTDIADGPAKLLSNEVYQQADLADYSAVHDLMAGAEMVVHFGAIADEAPFEKILGPNIIGAYNVWEAAYQHRLRRVIYASSIHAVGMYPKNQRITVDTPHRPDTFYGLAKCFAEDLGRMYWEKRGLESVCLRILSCAPVTGTRALGSWLSDDDLVRLVNASIDTPSVEFSVAYGVSDNDRNPVDNTGAGFLGYRPHDNAEKFAKDILTNAPAANPADPGQTRHGGPFAALSLGESAASAMAAAKVRR